MGNRRGILCSARHRPQEVCVGGVGYLLKSTSMVVTVTMCAPPPEIAGSASPNWAAAAAATAAAQLGLWACMTRLGRRRVDGTCAMRSVGYPIGHPGVRVVE